MDPLKVDDKVCKQGHELTMLMPFRNPISHTGRSTYLANPLTYYFGNYLL